jgi:hypothetical protein
MARLTRQPCAKCGEDTLHSHITCTVCGTIVQMKQSSRQIHAKRAIRLKRAGLNRYQIAATMLWNTVESPFKRDALEVGREIQAAKIAACARRKRATTDGLGNEGTFGRGRERTRC